MKPTHNADEPRNQEIKRKYGGVTLFLTSEEYGVLVGCVLFAQRRGNYLLHHSRSDLLKVIESQSNKKEG